MFDTMFHLVSNLCIKINFVSSPYSGQDYDYHRRNKRSDRLKDSRHGNIIFLNFTCIFLTTMMNLSIVRFFADIWILMQWCELMVVRKFSHQRLFYFPIFLAFTLKYHFLSNTLKFLVSFKISTCTSLWFVHKKLEVFAI